MSSETAPSPSRGFWILSGLALLWNLIGIVTYLMTVTMSEETMAAMSEAERALYEQVPAWATAAYAIAVFGGTLGCVGLLLRKGWSVPVFVVSLVAIVVQMGQAFLATDVLAVRGVGAAVLPALILVIAIWLVWFARSARAKGWLA